MLVRLTNQQQHAVDLVVFATGVNPNTAWLPPELDRGPDDGGVAVDASMQSSIPGIFAAGDCCWVRPEARGPQWFQMRLWTQVRPLALPSFVTLEPVALSSLHFALFCPPYLC